MTTKKTTKKAPVKAPKTQSPLRVGNTVLIRTVTFFHVGEVVFLDALEVVLKGASWVADTGRWNEALKTGKLSEVEPFDDGICSVGRGTIVDAANWSHSAPTAVI
jgi:hypothetical protein